LLLQNNAIKTQPDFFFGFFGPLNYDDFFEGQGDIFVSFWQI